MSVAGESKMKVHELSDLLLRFAKPLDGKRLALLEEETSGLGRTRVRNELHVLGRENPLDCGGLDKGGVKCFSRVCKLLQSNGRRLRPCVGDCRARRRPKIRISDPRMMMASNPVMAA